MNNETLKKVENVIIDIESNSRVRKLIDNEERLKGYYEIGRLLVEAQGGATRAKYGDNLIKKLGDKLAQEYGKNYNYTNLSRYRQFYLIFPNIATLSQKLSWSHYVELIPIKNENERNYYMNQVLINNLSVRELRNEIRNKSFKRLSYADKNIKENYHNKTEGILLVREKNKLVTKYVSNNNLYNITYLLENKKVQNGK